MDINGMTRQERLNHWARLMSERNRSGKNVRSWCLENRINEKTYYYWHRKLRIAACEQVGGLPGSGQTRLTSVGFAQVTMRESHSRLPTREESGVICVEAAGLRISADSSYPTEKLTTLLLRLVGV
jgi:hypothetical protein